MTLNWKGYGIIFLFLFTITNSQTLPRLQKNLDKPFYRNSYSTVLKDTIKILAVMVEFEIDDDPLTTGNGTFDLTFAPNQIDPPPHNFKYFEGRKRSI